MARYDELIAANETAKGECILWWAGRTTDGYGLVWLQGRTQSAHRVAYEAFVGPIPAGLQIDHLCRVRACVNYRHLEAVTSQVNNLRGTGLASENAGKTHCPRGHPLVGDNLRPSELARGRRVCLTCNRERRRAARAARKANDEAVIREAQRLIDQGVAEVMAESMSIGDTRHLCIAATTPMSMKGN